VLIYLKAAALVGMETELLGYKGKAPDFPNESTLDQFYSDAKFEAHRAVGYALADGLIAALAARAPATVPSTVLSNPVMAWF
jgi:hypothetical protein